MSPSTSPGLESDSTARVCGRESKPIASRPSTEIEPPTNGTIGTGPAMIGPNRLV